MGCGSGGCGVNRGGGGMGRVGEGCGWVGGGEGVGCERGGGGVWEGCEKGGGEVGGGGGGYKQGSSMANISKNRINNKSLYLTLHDQHIKYALCCKI